MLHGGIMGSRKAGERAPSRDVRKPAAGNSPVRDAEAVRGSPFRAAPAVPDPAPPSQIIRRALYLMARKAFPTDAALAEAIGVHRSQITRWKAGDPANSENAWLLRDFAFAGETLSEHFEASTAHAWLHGRSPELEGETPVEAIRGGRLADVLMAIQAQASGAYL